MFDELVGPADANHRDVNPFLAEEFEHRAAVTAHEDMVFEGHHHFGHTGEPRRQFLVDRLGEAGVDDGAVEALGGELFRRLFATFCMLPSAKSVTLWPRAAEKS